MNKQDKNLALVQEKIGYKFSNAALLQRALTHSSLTSENYERLEFLGDGILDFVVGDYLFEHGRELDEGKLTKMRAHFVSENNLCKIFDGLGIENCVLLGKSYKGSISKSVKGDIVEAIIAGIYLDGGLDECKKFIIKKLDLGSFASVKDDNFKSILQELIQSSFKCKMQYITEKADDGFLSKFYMDEDYIEKGQGLSKQEAEQDCARKAIKKLFKNY